jgi:hypothetical protein
MIAGEWYVLYHVTSQVHMLDIHMHFVDVTRKSHVVYH